MKIDLQGKLAIVSGSTAGIGLAIAEGLARANANVVINGRDAKKVNAVVEKLQGQFPAVTIKGVATDLSQASGTLTLINAVPHADILVNNAGIYGIKDFKDITDEDWYHIFDANVMSAVRLSRHYHPLMLKNNWGRIVFISSESAVNIPTEMIHYGVTKTAMLSIARGLAEVSVGSEVTVNSVLPGPTLTEGVREFMNQFAAKEGIPPEHAEKALIQKLRPTSLLQRLASPEEVANMVVYTCSKQASATNGAALRVDGGVLRSIV